MYNNSSDHELERNTILNRSGNSFKRTKIQLRKAMSECEDIPPYDPTMMNHLPQSQSRNNMRETNFHSPVKKKTKNSVAFTQPLLQQSPQIANHPHLHPMDDFKAFNTVKTPDYLLAQQQRIKEYSNGGRNNTDVSYSDTYSSSSSDYRAVGVVRPKQSTGGINKGQINKLHGSKNSLLTRKSTQSLCSCDADTELVPDPLRPLYQYSLDRKKTRHTYTCEQNAQILLRLEKEHQKKYGSAGRLFSACSSDLDTTNILHRTSYGSAINLNTNSLDDRVRIPTTTTTTNTNAPNYNHDNNNEQNNSLDYQNNSTSSCATITDTNTITGRQPTFVATIYRRTDSSGIHGNYSYDAGNCVEVNEREMKMSLLLSVVFIVMNVSCMEMCHA